MRRIGLAALLAALAAWPCAAAPLAAYGNLPTIEQVAISPNGRLLAIDVTKGEQRSVVVQDLVAKKIVTGVKVGETKLRSMQWAGDDHLILTSSVTGGIVGVLAARSEWFVATDLNIPAHRFTPLLADLPEMTGLNVTDGDPIVRTVGGKTMLFLSGIHFDQGQGRVSLFRIDLDTDRSNLMVVGGDHTRSILVSADGRALAEEEYDPNSSIWGLRILQGSLWKDVQERKVGIETPQLLGLGRDGASVLIEELADGVPSLRELSPDGATLSDPLPVGRWDGLLRDPANHRLIGTVKLAGDDLKYDYFNPSDQAQWDAIAAAFQGSQVSLVSQSDNRRQLIVHVDSPADGPGFALVDLDTKSTLWLGAEYGGLSENDISPVIPITYPAADGLTIQGYLTLPRGRDPRKLPLVVLVHGGPAARDEPGFDWWSQGMASAGYAVLRVNYRGSEGYGWKFLSAGFGEWGRKMQTDVSDGVRYLAAQGTIDPARVCIAGASYGGYAAAAGATLDTGVYRCAIDAEGPVELARFVAWSKSRQGDEGLAAQRYWTRFMGADGLADPHLQAISPADLASKVTIPFMLIHGKDDTVVPFEQSQMMADALKAAGRPYEFVVLNHEDHWLSHADTRLQLLQATIDFLDKNNPSS